MRTSTSWEAHIPPVRGVLPNGAPLRRTDPAGPAPAPVAILGVYPALTEKKLLTVRGLRMWLPTEVERQSFEPSSASGAELNENYLEPLGLTREVVFITDLVPYFYANTDKSTSGRSMADNVRLYEKHIRRKTGVEPRPSSDDLVQLVSTMPGNLDRLRSYMAQCQPQVLLTLGTESTAFVRGYTFKETEARNAELLYSEPEELHFLGVAPKVVHLIHPRHFIRRTSKNEHLRIRHSSWCAAAGRELIASILS